MIPEFVDWLLSGWFDYIGDVNNNRYLYEQTFADVCKSLSVWFPVLICLGFYFLVKAVFKK